MKNLIENGIEFEGKIIELKIRAIACDSPAKAFICGIFGHTSSHGCTKCVQVGRKINKVLTYSTESGVLISEKYISFSKNSTGGFRSQNG
ncbi:hypothetical protein CVS40_8255 [Lucilia cuprina]|nr:hypothetical protein CVS40_8255 [Lucilia cuprina]